MNPKLDASLHFLLLFCAIIAYVRNRGKASLFLRFSFLYIVATIVFDGVAAAIMFTNFMSGVVTDNLFVYHLLTPIQYTIVVQMFRDVIKNEVAKRWLLHSIPAFWMVAVILTLFVQPLDDYPTYSFLTKYILIMPIVLYYLIELLDSPYDDALTREPAFWIGTGFLFHSVGNVFVQGFSNELFKHSHPLFYILNTVSSILNYVLFLCFIIAFVGYFKFFKRERNTGSY